MEFSVRIRVMFVRLQNVCKLEFSLYLPYLVVPMTAVLLVALLALVAVAVAQSGAITK